MAEQCALENNLKVILCTRRACQPQGWCLGLQEKTQLAGDVLQRGTQVEKYCMKNVKSGQFNIHFNPPLLSSVSFPLVLQVGHYTTVFLCLYGGGGNTFPAFIAASDKYSWFSATAGRMRPFCR